MYVDAETLTAFLKVGKVELKQSGNLTCTSTARPLVLHNHTRRCLELSLLIHIVLITVSMCFFYTERILTGNVHIIYT